MTEAAAGLDRHHASIAQARATPIWPGERSARVLAHRTMLVRCHAPCESDPQTRHGQDEIYVVASGRGTFFNNGARHQFQTGDVLSVPAGIGHRFENFTDDFAAWAVLQGPTGGEREASAAPR
ncbi:MAG: cupin domain-containing protein [Alphaproteobacteria bacterium]